MRLESLFLALSISGGCPALDDAAPISEADTKLATGLVRIQGETVAQFGGDNPSSEGNPTSEDNPELEPVEGITVYQEMETFDTPDGEACRLTFETVGDLYDDKCNDCLFAFEVQTALVGDAETDDCQTSELDNEWLLRAYDVDTAGEAYGAENFRLQFKPTVDTGDKMLTNVLISVVDVYESVGNGDEVEVVELTQILAHDESGSGRAGVRDGRVWWTLDDGVTRIMASGIFAE
jgi:hypothetical protein